MLLCIMEVFQLKERSYGTVYRVIYDDDSSMARHTDH